jgi:hypothetical protein
MQGFRTRRFLRVTAAQRAERQYSAAVDGGTQHAPAQSDSLLLPALPTPLGISDVILSFLAQ